MKLTSSEGIILYRRELNEIDIMVTVFTKVYGKVNFLLKGMKKSKKREQSALDVLTITKFILMKKEEQFSATQFELLDQLENVKNSLEKIYISLYLVDVLNKVMMEGEANRKIYDLSVKTLKYFEKEDVYWKKILCVAYFLYKILEHEGILDKDKEYFFYETKKLSQTASNLIKNIFSDKMKDNISILLQLPEKVAEEEAKRLVLDMERYFNVQMDIQLNLNKFILG